MNASSTTPRKGSLLENMVASTFKQADFDVVQNKYLNGYEIDVLASLGDTQIIIECKQYESSYLSIRNLIFEWAGKNEKINADKILLVIYGTQVNDENHELALSKKITIWNVEDLEYINEIDNVFEKRQEILTKLNLSKRSISYSNYHNINLLFVFEALRSGGIPDEEFKYEKLREYLRKRIIGDLKYEGSDANLRAQHIDFFENLIETTKTEKRLLIFKKKVAKSHEEIWNDIKIKLSDECLSESFIFSKSISAKYFKYICDLDEGYKKFQIAFYKNSLQTIYLIIKYRLYSLDENKFSILKLKRQNLNPAYIYMCAGFIGLSISNEDLNKLEWILTSTNYSMNSEDISILAPDEQILILKLNVLWHTDSIDETIDFMYRILTEFYNISDFKQISDIIYMQHQVINKGSNQNDA